jgi:hypothetical protein
MVNCCAVCGCCTRTDIVRGHLEDTLRICGFVTSVQWVYTSNTKYIINMRLRESSFLNILESKIVMYTRAVKKGAKVKCDQVYGPTCNFMLLILWRNHSLSIYDGMET